MSGNGDRCLRFGNYELDSGSGKLTCNGQPVKIQPQPLRVLGVLVEHQGGIVSREQFRDRIWGDATFVEFDQGLNYCIRQIRLALGDDASKPAYVETLPKQGYRFIASVTGPEPEEAGLLIEKAPIEETTTIEPGGDVGSPRWRWKLAFAILVLAPIIGVTGWRIWPQAGSHHIRSIAVLPLRNISQDPDQQYFADGMTEVLTTGLAQLSQLTVIAKTSVMHYQGTQKSTPQIAKELNVDAVVEGSVQTSNGHVLITAELIDGSTDRHLWAKSYERDIGDALALQNEVAQAIAAEINLRLTPEEKSRLVRRQYTNPEAQEAYLRGLYWYDQYQMGKSFGYLLDATKKDPNFAPAYAALSTTYPFMIYEQDMPMKEAYPEWRTAAFKAIELDHGSAEAHVSLGFLLLNHDWNWAEAERELKRAIQLNPNLAEAHLWYSADLGSMGRVDEALAEGARGVQLSPYSHLANVIYTEQLIGAGQFPRALEQGRKMLDFAPDAAHYVMGLAYEQMDESASAMGEFRNEVNDTKRSFTSLANLAHVYAMAGNKPQAMKLLSELQALSKRRPVDPYEIALVFVGLGDKNRAFELLDKCYDERPNNLPELTLDARMNPLRSDPRYRELLLRMGLPR
jgi:TolB-like protein/DNA-binding winged helix-turn-helix (wHTH) protein/Flp pilus assembly protein TadD